MNKYIFFLQNILTLNALNPAKHNVHVLVKHRFITSNPINDSNLLEILELEI